MKKYIILVFGCQMNQSDSERIIRVLNNMGLEETSNIKLADLAVMVACSVRQSAIDRVYGQSYNWQARRTKGKLFAILTGCVMPKDKEKLQSRFDLVLDVKDIGRLPQKLGGLRIIDRDYFHINPKHQSNWQAQVPIMTGCNNFCSYCVVPYVRGREVSRSVEKVIAECKQLISSGYKEITLLGQNVNSYKSGKYDFTKLLYAIDKIAGDYWLRFVTSHPKDLSGELIKVMAKGKHITPYLHLPIQSGDNQILKLMNRKYTVSHYLKLVEKVRRVVPNIMLSTDIIVGFPSETKEQFKNSVRLMKKVKFDMAFISQYSTRLGTVAAKLADNVSKSEKTRREKELIKVLKQTAKANNKMLIGHEVEVLVDSCKNDQCVGKTKTFKVVKFKGRKKIVGNFVKVRVNKVQNWWLVGEVI
ncbi:MAG TPA: tRNA (N6-isopentenyl adenosine(37)-C2)-methylthiotransferase MiaB [Patescibacteria group bacterium]|nr:tRNA (N6-isopentenyl adenosine(37)-C2)-methylthiotransferase MiaB [Patescibacteria group bacterium]